jgi:hypothetical protein
MQTTNWYGLSLAFSSAATFADPSTGSKCSFQQYYRGGITPANIWYVHYGLSSADDPDTLFQDGGGFGHHGCYRCSSYIGCWSELNAEFVNNTGIHCCWQLGKWRLLGCYWYD